MNFNFRGLWLVRVYCDLKKLAPCWTTPFTETERGEGAAAQRRAPGKAGPEDDGAPVTAFRGTC